MTRQPNEESTSELCKDGKVLGYMEIHQVQKFGEEVQDFKSPQDLVNAVPSLRLDLEIGQFIALCLGSSLDSWVISRLMKL